MISSRRNKVKSRGKYLNVWSIHVVGCLVRDRDGNETSILVIHYITGSNRNDVRFSGTNP